MQNGFEETGPGFVLTTVLAAILMYMTSLSELQAIESLGIHAGFALVFTLVAVCTIYAPALAINAQKHSEKGVRCLGCLPECCCPCSVSEEEVTSSAADRCTARLAALMNNCSMRILIILLFLALAAVSAYFCSKIEREKDT